MPRGLAVVSRDAYGGDTTTEWDDLALLPARVTDPAGLATSAVYDYRIFKPAQVTDPNGNITSIGYTPLGLPAQIARLGKNDGTEGDTDSEPSQTFGYDLTAYDESDRRRSSQPSADERDHGAPRRPPLDARQRGQRGSGGKRRTPAHRRGDHGNVRPGTEPEEHPDRFIHTVEFTDGMGRPLQTRTQADNVTVSTTGLSGDTVSSSEHCHRRPGRPRHRPARRRQRLEGLRQQGPPRPHLRTVLRHRLRLRTRPDPTLLTTLAAAIQHYDPRGRPTVTIAPDGSQTRVIYGTPTLAGQPRGRSPQPVGNLHLRRQRQRRPHPPHAHPRTRRTVEHTSQHARRRARPHRPDRAARPGQTM